MAISEAQVKLIKYPPELLPDSVVCAVVPLNGEVAPPVLELRNFKPYLTHVTNIQMPANAAVTLRARSDNITLEENTFNMLRLTAALEPLPNRFWLTAKDNQRLNFFGVVGAPIANYPAHYGLWVYPPTIAHKLRYGISLSDAEKAIASELGIANTVDKGLLPLPINELINREYQVMDEETHARSVTITVANTPYTIEVLHPRTNEILVLTRIAAVGAVADNVRFIISRDDDDSFRDLPAFPMSLIYGGEIECFIPALRELRLTTQSTLVPAGASLFRYTFQRIRLTNILRFRFGLLTLADATTDPLKECYKKVAAGVV